MQLLEQNGFTGKNVPGRECKKMSGASNRHVYMLRKKNAFGEKWKN